MKKYSEQPMQSANGYQKELRALSLDGLEDALHAFEHRKNYETLKAAFENLQKNYSRSKEAWKIKLKEMQLKERQTQAKLQEANKNIQFIQAGFSVDLHSEVDNQWFEKLKLKITEDMQRKYEEEIDRAHASVLVAEEESKRLNEEIAALHSQLETAKSEAHSALSQQKILYEAEISNLRQIKEDLLSRNQCLSTAELDRNKDECKQNAQLLAKCMLLMDEVEDLKEQLETQKNKFQSGNEDLLKSITELKLQNRELDAERGNLNKQLLLMRQEVEQLRGEVHAERQRAVDATQASAEADYKLSQLTQRTRTELTNLRLEAQEQRVAIEKQRDQFASKAQELEHKLEIMSVRCQQVESDASAQVLAAVEKEAMARDQWAREKASLEAKCTEFANRLKMAQKFTANDKNGSKNESTDATHLDQNAATEKRLEILREEMEKLKEKLKQAELRNSQLEHILQMKAEWTATCEKTDESADLLISSLRSKLKSQEELEAQLHSARVNLKRYMESASKKKQLHTQCIRKLKEFNQFAKLEIEKLKTENHLLRQNVPQEEYHRVRLLLDDLKRRHEEYQNIILGPSHPFLLSTDPNCCHVDTTMTWYSEDITRNVQMNDPSKSTTVQVPIERMTTDVKRICEPADSPQRRTHPEGSS